AAGRPRPGHPVLLRALLRGPRPAPAAVGPDDPAAGQLGHARRAVHRGGGERPAVRDAVPPREVRRRGCRAAGQLAGDGVMSTPALTLLPAVDVAGGQAVRLVQGAAGSETGYGDPLAAALAWQAAGAEWVHLVDLDAAFGRGSNADLLAAVVARLDIAVELSGGIRDDASLAAALATGCARPSPRMGTRSPWDWTCGGPRWPPGAGPGTAVSWTRRWPGWTPRAARGTWSPTSSGTACCAGPTWTCCGMSAPGPRGR